MAVSVECFIEGTRSRTGKLLPPKLGILKYVLDALDRGRTEDVWICPISLQYDKVSLLVPHQVRDTNVVLTRRQQVIETESYVNELLGNPKEKETCVRKLIVPFIVPLLTSFERHSLAGLLLNTRVIQLQLGRIDVRFQEPFSLKGWLDDQKKRRTAPMDAPPGYRKPKSDQTTLLRALGYEVLAGINDCA